MGQIAQKVSEDNGFSFGEPGSPILIRKAPDFFVELEVATSPECRVGLGKGQFFFVNQLQVLEDQVTGYDATPVTILQVEGLPQSCDGFCCPGSGGPACRAPPMGGL
ncbi:MAG: hypothetical protein D6722_05380 [Bacteroidetes bacterium]|nr:MAG: hypothetical protein D6722_05380 [Bacteroidota bacterium]